MNSTQEHPGAVSPQAGVDLAAKNRGKYAVMEFALGGEPAGFCVIRLFADDAPNTVENFIQLSERGFYNGLTFHRIVRGFMMQGGDPTGTGMGGPGYHIPAEFNERRHATGTVAMARGAEPDTAGSQFYICLAPAPHLNHNYTVFGQITEGTDTVLALGEIGTDENGMPIEPLTITRIEIIDGPLA